ncbi:class I SAM-dependent methyltransferase [Candidatus Thiodictyon syntrophicum]|jgi:2-polyprenyl-3-methyl-5-hydroxy-6-metoxy-1,4-benzoquinol methylase|uniref:SAM-dependent methyltransferase n=1 Tax=Candidatus Thiodictyon syntrophicum TaxID=1166950 RepID=A0A2K8UF41_9GAMM|nr:class I SAM-dependent methyltransferase [Candidatus Thiodictyon syntrophicum]AUB84162.1 SAM-dependent methyltransferase [Candidatus Thiodictyon syntrophicum]
MKCRHCGADLKLPLVDLGSAPPSNAYLTESTLRAPERWFPLRVLVCEDCWLAQTEDFTQAHELFSTDYAYFSGFSRTWLAHCERYVNDMVMRLQLTAASQVVEIAANDGSLLQYVLARGIPCTGVEPTADTAAAARAKGIPIVAEFFGVRLAQDLAAQGLQADLAVANNVLAHVPDINDFVAGVALLLKPGGVATFEFPHLLRLIAENQFDTIYHEHFSYLSLTAVRRIFAANGLAVFDVEAHPTHGGSLRVFAQRAATGRQPCSPRVAALLHQEVAVGMTSASYYRGFQTRTDRVKDDFLAFLLDAKRRGKTVAGYGAAAKGNTLLNYAGVRPDLLPFVVDRNPAKQGKYLPGSRIPITGEERLRRTRPDVILVLPWNLKTEVMQQLAYARTWGARFVTAVPTLENV